MKPSLSTRRARIVRVNAKRPDVEVEIACTEQAGKRAAFVDLIIGLLDARRHSGGR